MRRALPLLLALLGLGSIAAAQDAEPRVVDGVTIPAGVTGAITWGESYGRGCHRYHARRVCEGPRRIPVSSAEQTAAAEALGITSGAARRALVERPRDTWIAAAGTAVPTDLGWPVDGGRVWRGFGIHAGIAVARGGRLRRTRRRQPHEGIDIGAPAGTAILAANDGLVIYSDNGMSGYGNAVLVVHPDASVTLYGHCTATFVVPGQHVTRGEVIATVGDTGLAHGAHLHFELHVDGHAIDPMPRIGTPPGAAAAEALATPPPSEEVDAP